MCQKISTVMGNGLADVGEYFSFPKTMYVLTFSKLLNEVLKKNRRHGKKLKGHVLRLVQTY
jgi:hypothetical protein